MQSTWKRRIQLSGNDRRNHENTLVGQWVIGVKYQIDAPRSHNMTHAGPTTLSLRCGSVYREPDFLFDDTQSHTCWTLSSSIYLLLRVGLALGFGKPSGTDASEKAQEQRSPFPLKHACSKDSLHLTPAFNKMDFSFQVPNNVISCGPILHQCPPLSEADPDLNAWLTMPTILISLGSHVKSSEMVDVQMAKGVDSSCMNTAACKYYGNFGMT